MLDFWGGLLYGTWDRKKPAKACGTNPLVTHEETGLMGGWDNAYTTALEAEYTFLTPKEIASGMTHEMGRIEIYPESVMRRILDEYVDGEIVEPPLLRG